MNITTQMQKEMDRCIGTINEIPVSALFNGAIKTFPPGALLMEGCKADRDPNCEWKTPQATCRRVEDIALPKPYSRSVWPDWIELAVMPQR